MHQNTRRNHVDLELSQHIEAEANTRQTYTAPSSVAGRPSGQAPDRRDKRSDRADAQAARASRLAGAQGRA
jgi:hypothetical protein